MSLLISAMSMILVTMKADELPELEPGFEELLQCPSGAEYVYVMHAEEPIDAEAHCVSKWGTHLATVLTPGDNACLSLACGEIPGGCTPATNCGCTIGLMKPDVNDDEDDPTSWCWWDNDEDCLDGTSFLPWHPGGFLGVGAQPNDYG
eukprot:27537_1